MLCFKYIIVNTLHKAGNDDDDDDDYNNNNNNNNNMWGCKPMQQETTISLAPISLLTMC